MKLENVNVAKLQLTDLPKFDKCPCELCDDGCFDRAGYQHHPECRRKLVERTKLPLALRCPISHYKATFQAATNIFGGPGDYRRQPYPPPPDNEIPTSFKNVPMSSISSQRDDYKPPPPGSIKKTSTTPVKQVNSSLSIRAVPMETQSHYQAEYIEKPFIPITLQPLKDTHVNIIDSKVPISSETTTQSHFKPWQSVPSQPYAEMPAVVGNILFPNSTRRFSTSSGSTFIPFSKVSPTKPIAQIENHGNFRVSGSMDLRTSYRDTYIQHKLSSARTSLNERKDKPNEEKVYTRPPMYAISQTSFDFRPYPNHRPPLPVDGEPFVSQITIGNSLAPIVTKTQYRSDYEGIDTSRYHRQPAAAPKDKQRPYVAPIEKMDTMTVTQRDFQPLDVTALPRIRLTPMKTTLPMNNQHAPMENITMSRYHYQPYEPIKPKRQYGEPIPEIYIPPTAKFEDSTTTGETYKGQPGQRARAYKPEIKILNRIGEHDHNTNYRIDYHPHGMTLCAAKAYAIAQNKQKTATPIAAQ